MKDNYIAAPFKDNHKYALALFIFADYIRLWSYLFRSQPRKNKIHRSGHFTIFFGLSVYLPYRYSPQINTGLFQLTQSKNLYVNKLVRIPAKVVIYGTSILLG